MSTFLSSSSKLAHTYATKVRAGSRGGQAGCDEPEEASEDRLGGLCSGRESQYEYGGASFLVTHSLVWTLTQTPATMKGIAQCPRRPTRVQTEQKMM